LRRGCRAFRLVLARPASIVLWLTPFTGEAVAREVRLGHLLNSVSVDLHDNLPTVAAFNDTPPAKRLNQQTVSLSRSFRHLNERKPKPELSASQGVPYKPETRLTADRRFLITYY
jgi:hypothetical protein